MIIFNTFFSFKHQISKTIKKKEQSPNLMKILNHIKEVYCCDNDKLYQYIIKWFASKFQYPNKKIGTSLVLKSDLEGAGKNIILDFIAEHVIGIKHIRLIDNIETLFKNFNADAETSIITVLDEIGNKSGAYKNADTLRSIVTMKTFMVEPKCIDKYCAHDYNDYVFITNNDWIVKVTMSDRRYCCFEVSQKYVGNIEYFNDIVKSCFNYEVGREFFKSIVDHIVMIIKSANIYINY